MTWLSDLMHRGKTLFSRTATDTSTGPSQSPPDPNSTTMDGLGMTTTITASDDEVHDMFTHSSMLGLFIDKETE